MKILTDQRLKDDHLPDYEIHWENSDSLQKGNCKIFTYGEGKEIAIATFRTLYPGYEMLKIRELRDVG